MSNKGLSSDIEIAIEDSIEGLQFDLGVTDIEDNKMKAAVKSKLSSFSSAKKLLERWVNSPNAPSHSKIQEYTSDLVDAGEVAKEQMRDALRKKINWGDLDADKRAAAQEAKPFILESIQSLNAGIVELRLQLDNDEINFSDKEFKIGFPERMAKGELFNTKDLYKNWYNEKEDAIKICPYGSEGEILNLYGLKVQLPEPPVSKKNILFSDKRKSEQYWRRTPMPKGLTRDNEDEYIEYIVEEFRRRVYGVWFMNNGKPTYITGHHYFMLQWYKDKDSGDYPNFRVAQAELAYHTKACEVDRRSLGQVVGKTRRLGLTTEKLARKLNLETMIKNFRSGFTSKTEKDVKEGFDKKQYAFSNLPFFFKPVVKGSDDSNIRIEFAKPSDRSKEAKKRQDRDADDYLNTLSDWRATTNDAYDSTKLNDYLGDEFAKWSSPANYLTHWAKVSPTMDENGIIVGKAFLGSTFESQKKGGREGKIIFNNSIPSKRDSVTKRTKTGLYHFFMPIEDNSAKHTDKYGVCHKTKPVGNPLNQAGEIIDTGSIEYYKAKEKSARDDGPEAFNEYKRNHPSRVEDLFRDKVQDSAFNLNNIQEQLDYIDLLHSASDLPLIEGDFSWKGGQKDTEVIWRPRKGGRFKVSWLPPSDLRNNITWKDGQRAPKNTWLGAGGLDPFGKNQTQDGNGSKGSIHFINRPNANYPETSRQFVLEYIHRPPTLSQFYEDALMAAVFYGYPIFYENDKSGIETYFESRGYLEYLMLRPERYDSRKNKKVRERGAPSRGIMIDAVYHALNDYINEYVGETKEGDMANMYFEDTLKDWMHFEPNNRTAYDASISSGYALCAIQVDAPREEKEHKVTIDVAPFRMYNNRGGLSKTIR